MVAVSAEKCWKSRTSANGIYEEKLEKDYVSLGGIVMKLKQIF